MCTLVAMGKVKKAGPGQLDMILDGMEDAELAAEYDLMVGVQVVHKCQHCNHRISAEESRVSGIGYDCAAELGRQRWAELERERERAEREAAAQE